MIHQPVSRIRSSGNSLDRHKPDGWNSTRKLDQAALRDSQTGLYHEEYFHEFLALEKKRCERSKGPLFLMLVDLSSFAVLSERQNVAKSMMEGLSGATRDTDVKGWHDEGLAIGIIFSEMAGKEAVPSFTPRHIADKWSRCLASCLGAERFSRVKISWQAFPEEFRKQTANLVLIR